MFGDLSEKYFEGRGKNDLINEMGEGPALLPEDSSQHKEILFNDAYHALNKGKVEDISP